MIFVRPLKKKHTKHRITILDSESTINCLCELTSLLPFPIQCNRDNNISHEEMDMKVLRMI